MSKRDDLVAKYTAELERIGMTVNADVLMGAVKACGPSIYNADSETVAGSDPEELSRVRDNFMAKRLGITDADAAQAALDEALDTIGRSNRTKYRAVLYYILATQTGTTARLA